MGVKVSRKSRIAVTVLAAALIALSICAVPAAMAKSSSSNALRFRVVKRTQRFDVVRGHHLRFAVKRRVHKIVLNGGKHYRVISRTHRYVVLRPTTRSVAGIPILVSPSSDEFLLGSSTTITWRTSAAVSSGSYGVSLKNVVSGATTGLTTSRISARRGATSYSVPWNVAQAAGAYTLWVSYYSSSGSLVGSDESNGTLSITLTTAPAPTPTVTPTGAPGPTPTPTPGVVLNVRDYGAKGDGVSNDYAALTKACAAAAAAGEALYLPAGTYLFNSRLTVPSGVNVAGGNGAWLHGPVSVASNSTWSNVRIGAVGSAVYIGNATGVTFNGVEFTGGGGAYDASYPDYDCHVFTVRSSSNLSFTNCTFDGNSGVENSAHGLHFNIGYIYGASHDITFTTCAFGTSPRFTVEMWDDSNPGGYNIAYDTCTFAHSSDATLDFSSYHGTNCYVTNCTFAGEGDSGTKWPNTITVEGGNTSVHITGSHFARGRGPAINFETGTNYAQNNVIDCTVDDGRYNASAEPYAKIEVQSTSSGNTITGNTIIPGNTSGYAVGLWGGTNIATGNTLRKGDTNYILNLGSGNTTSPNTLE